MKLISVYLEYVVVSEYTHEQNSLVKRNHLNLIHEKEERKKKTQKQKHLFRRGGKALPRPWFHPH